MVEFLERKHCLDFSKITLLYPDQFQSGRSPEVKTLGGCLEELRFSLWPLHGDHPAIEPGCAASKVIPFFRRRKLHYDYCVAADLTGWQIAYPLRKLGYVSCLVYDDQDYFPLVVENLLGRIFTAGLENLISRASDGVISVSVALAEVRRRQGATNVRIIPNGVDSSFLNEHAEVSRRRLSNRIIFYAGYLDRGHGVDILLDAFLQLPAELGARLVITGLGPLEGILRKKSRDSAAESRIQMLGRVGREQLPKLLDQATLGVAPYRQSSLASAGDPLKLKEYLALGLPVVTTNVGGIPSLFKGSSAGLIVEDSPEELSGAMLRILKLTDSVYAKMHKDALALGEQYSWDRIFGDYFEYLSGLNHMRS